MALYLEHVIIKTLPLFD